MASTLRMRAHNHIATVVAAMDSCFALIGAHHHGIAVGSMSGGTRLSKHSVYMEKTCPGQKSHSPTRATLGKQPFSYVSLKNWQTVYTRNKKVARLAEPAFLHMNILARQARSTRDNQIDIQSKCDRCFQLLVGAEGLTFGGPLFSCHPNGSFS